MVAMRTRENKGFEVQFYDYQGDSSYVVACKDTDEVARCLSQWCWSRIHGNCPTVWLDGKQWRGKSL